MRSELSKINVDGWRDDASGPMQVVSGPIGRQRVHFEAPPAERLEAETSRFLEWLNGASNDPPLLKAGLGHLWFVTLHPFDDGNGRIARAIGDLLLARADGSPQRFYSLSAQIQRERKAYYNILERTQKRSMDVTEWLACSRKSSLSVFFVEAQQNRAPMRARRQVTQRSFPAFGHSRNCSSCHCSGWTALASTGRPSASVAGR